MDQLSKEELLERIAKLESEIKDLRGVSIFSDIQPIVEQKADKFRMLEIATIGLKYRVRWEKPGILREIWQRVAQDLKQEETGIQLLHPVRGTVLSGDEPLSEFVNEDSAEKVINLDFQFNRVKSQATCGGHNDDGHYHDHDDDDDLSDDFSDDDGFGGGCSCSHH